MRWARLKDYWTASDPDRRAFAVGYALVLPFFLAPILVTRYLPGLDLPFHLSIADLLIKGAGPDSPYAAYYLPRLGIAPYAAHYMGLVVLGQVVSLAVAHNIIMGFYVALLPLGVASILARCRLSLLPALLAFPLAYNMSLHYGFVSFCLSLPVMLFWFAATMAAVRRSDGKSWVFSAALGALLFLSHLQNYLFGVCGVVAIVVCCRVPWRARLRGLSVLLPGFVFLVYWLATRPPPPEARAAVEQGGLAFAWRALVHARRTDLANRPVSVDLVQRVQELPEMLLKGFQDRVDVVAASYFFLLVGAYVLWGLMGALQDRGSQLPKSRFLLARWVLLFGAAVAFFALPHHLWAFELMTFFPRFSALLALMLLLIIPQGLRAIGGAMRWAVLCPLVLFCALYGHQVFTHYRAYRAEIADFVRIVNRIEVGKKVVALIYNRKSTVMRIESPFVGMMGFYVATRPHPDSFVPLHYCGMRHMPCDVTAAAAALPYPGPWMERPIEWDKLIETFDYILLREPPPGRYFGTRSADLRKLAHDGSWQLFKRVVPRRGEKSTTPLFGVPGPGDKPQQ